MGGNKKILAGALVVVGALVYLAFAGFQEGKAYYKTIAELDAMGERAYDRRIRVGGTVSEGTIERHGTKLTFQLQQNDLTLAVRYVGTSPVPDTFVDGAEALCDGYYHTDGTFEAHAIQAKCASKYEAEYTAENAEH